MNSKPLPRPLLIALILFIAAIGICLPASTAAIAGDRQIGHAALAAKGSFAKTHKADEYRTRRNDGMVQNRVANAFADPEAALSVGTGWPIETGFVVTNNHVVYDSVEIILVDGNGNEMAAWPVLKDERHDIALLAVEEAEKLPPALPLALIQEGKGTDVFTVGFPKPESPNDLPRRASGIISGVLGVNQDPYTYQTTVPIQPGNSGGPLLNMNGEVIGVVTAMLAYKDPVHGTVEMVPNASSARKISCVTELLSHLPANLKRLSTLPRKRGNLDSLSERIGNSVMKVVSRSRAD